MVQWLRRPEHLARWSLFTIALALATFFLAVAAVCPSPSFDIRIMAALLAAAILGTLTLRWRATEAGWIDKGALYVAVVMAVYFDRQTDTLLEATPALQLLLFGILVLSIIFRFRLASDRSFRVTTLDVLVIFIAVAVPNLPGSVTASATLGEGIAKLIALMYGVETLLGAAASWWRLPSVAALVFVSVCALQGTF